MSTTTTVVLVSLTTLSCLTSAATLAIVLVGGKKAQEEIEQVKTKTNDSVRKLKSALDNLEF